MYKKDGLFKRIVFVMKYRKYLTWAQRGRHVRKHSHELVCMVTGILLKERFAEGLKRAAGAIDGLTKAMKGIEESIVKTNFGIE